MLCGKLHCQIVLNHILLSEVRANRKPRHLEFMLQQRPCVQIWGFVHLGIQPRVQSKKALVQVVLGLGAEGLVTPEPQP